VRFSGANRQSIFVGLLKVNPPDRARRNPRPEFAVEKLGRNEDTGNFHEL
jgi:hypothetical protein